MVLVSVCAPLSRLGHASFQETNSMTIKQRSGLFIGNWRNVDVNTQWISKLTVSDNSGKPAVRAWGVCQSADCDMGIAEVTLEEAELVGNIDGRVVNGRPYKKTGLRLSFEKDGRLKVVMSIRYLDDSGRSGGPYTMFFVRQ